MKMALTLMVLMVAVSQAQKRRGHEQFGDEARLLQRLLRGYQKATRPVANASHTIVVKVNFALTQILDMDEKNQVLTTNVWFLQEWKDEKLVWDPAQYNGLSKIRIPPDLIWRPDIVLYNGVDDYGDKVYAQCLAMVSYDGTVFWAPIANLRSTCKLDLTFFPFDDQVCVFKIGSWTYDGFQVDLTNKSADMDLKQYTVNGGWDLIATRTRRNVVYYPCCPEPFPDVTFTIYLRRRTLYYIINVVVPCVLLSGLSMLGFLLPVGTGEKVSLGLTILLAFYILGLSIADEIPETSEYIPLTGFWLPVGTSDKVNLGLTVLLAFYVLGLSIADRVPDTSEFVPLIGVYLMVIMILTSISVALCVFILHLHRLGTRCVDVPLWLHRIVTRYLARLVGMSYIIKHRQRSLRAAEGDADCEETRPLRIECEDLNARYKLIQVEGSGLYILAKDAEAGAPLEKDDKDDINDLHRAKERGKVLRAMKAVMVNGSSIEQTGPSPCTLRQNELMWHDIAEIVDRLFFWLCFITVTISTVCILVILPLSKPDPMPDR